jgi:hypothetical protein
MSKKVQARLERSARRQEEAQADSGCKVLMRFNEDKYYNDLNKPIFEKGKIYELEGRSWIDRWTKRGGGIVEKADGPVASGLQPQSEGLNGLAAPLGNAPSVEEEGSGEEYMRDARSLNNEDIEE